MNRITQPSKYREFKTESGCEMRWEVMNMSDFYTLESDDFAAACGACLLLGNGNYGLVPISKGAPAMPMFLLVPVEGIDRWLKENNVAESVDALFSRREEIATALDSVVIGDRDEYTAELRKIHDPIERVVFKGQWLDAHRTSMNNIGERAWKLAESMRKPKPEKTYA